MYSCFIHRIILDWGLGRRDYGYLGPRLMFPKKSYYYMGEHWIDFAIAHSSTRLVIRSHLRVLKSHMCGSSAEIYVG